ncbi:hypothetical protein SK128_017495 [Halocaridina rubra]|uniref:Uncharacterized protein n=1 Tax=Halocaridina rubra TaxID=373956 RepID=A0AAN8XAA0_HALRR
MTEDFGVKDGENGEITKGKIIILRRQSEHHMPSSSPSRILYRSPFPNSTSHLRERQLYRGCRIRDALDRLKRGQRCQLPYGLSYEEFVKLAYRESSTEKTLFRIPPSSLSTSGNDQSKINPKAVCISIWSEFYFGTSVLDEHVKYTAVQRVWYERFMEILYRGLQQWCSETILTWILYTVFFFAYFYSLLVYNMFLELIFLILLKRHLRIHERAYEHNLNIIFTGSVFQGPAYSCVRTWCCHCTQLDHSKIVLKLMKKMKKDILERRVNPNS